MNALQISETLQDFSRESAECWRRLPDKGLFLTLLAAWLLLFQFLGNSTLGYVHTTSLMYWMYNAYVEGSPDDAHGLLIPFAVVALFYWKRKALLAVQHATWWPGLLIV